MDKHIERMRDFASHDCQISQMKEQIQEKDKEIAKLKEAVKQIQEKDKEKDEEIAKLNGYLDEFDNRIRVLEHCCFD